MESDGVDKPQLAKAGSLLRPSYDPATSDCCQRPREKPARSHQPTHSSVLIHPDLPEPPNKPCKVGTETLPAPFMELKIRRSIHAD
ncbi:protein TIF31 [Sarotherodon galilaeus]